jgi:UDPglucose--hexose-1-phosphate uridylyltransferase
MREPELRQDPMTKDWVIIAPVRAKRSHSREITPHTQAATPDHHCPFCLGNEALTPPEVYRDADPEGSWLVRVVPNKFAALSPSAGATRKEGFFRTAPGIGYHEVIIETPNHAGDISEMSREHVARILLAYRERQRKLSEDSRVRFVVVFRNHGERAGTSLVHPHSQLVATAVVPALIRRKHEMAERYFDDTGRCVYCDVRDAEIADGSRLIEDTDPFAVFAPFASRSPFEMWILPHEMRASFALATDGELDSLACILRRCLRRLRACCGDVDYNYVIHSCPRKDEDEEYYLWHVQIVPRLSEPAGFEIGSGMYINTVAPEIAAQQLRSASLGE